MLLKSKDRLIRVLEEREGQKLIVSCIQKSMPVWISERELQSYVPCEEAALSSELPDYEELSPEQRRYAHERYTLIAGVIPFLGDKTIRCETIERIASSRNISKQTIRYYPQFGVSNAIQGAANFPLLRKTVSSLHGLKL